MRTMRDGNDASTSFIVPDIDRRILESLETATLSLGCFCGAEAEFGCTEVVFRTRVECNGGNTPFPPYHNLGYHSEAIQIEFEPRVLPLTRIVEFFWAKARPRHRSRGRQYMHAFWYQSDNQKEVLMASQNGLGVDFGAELQRSVLPLTMFYPAENRHQKYRVQHPLLMPLFQNLYTNFADFNDSTAAARLIGFVVGRGSRKLFEAESHRYGISPQDMLKHILFPVSTSTILACHDDTCSVV